MQLTNPHYATAEGSILMVQKYAVGKLTTFTELTELRFNHRLIKYSLDNLRPIITAEAVDWFHQRTWLHCRTA